VSAIPWNMLYMPRVFDETFAQPEMKWLDHIQGTNVSEWRCLECGLIWIARDDLQESNQPVCNHVEAYPDYDG
jgi:hypothetical protein